MILGDVRYPLFLTNPKLRIRAWENTPASGVKFHLDAYDE